MTSLKASYMGQEKGFSRQDWMQQQLIERHDHRWINSRQLPTKMNINLAELIRGDLVNLELNLSMEVQTSENQSTQVGWKKSKYLLSEARWQCFVYDIPGSHELRPLFIRTDELKYVLGSFEDVGWETWGAVLLDHGWLCSNGASTFDEFLALYRK